jgi:hypothetical protein
MSSLNDRLAPKFNRKGRKEGTKHANKDQNTLCVKP